MSPLFYLPSIALGLFYALSSGNWLMLGATVSSGLIALALSSRTKAIPDGQLQVKGSRVWLGEHRLPRLPWLWSKKLRNQVLTQYRSQQSPSLESLRQLRSAGWKTSVAQGYRLGAEMCFDLSQGAGHLLVIGPTGSGKSELLHLAAASLGENVELAVADYKGGAVLTELRVEQATSDLESSEMQARFWSELSTELENREMVLRKQGFASIELAHRQSLGFNRKLIIVDEVVAAIRGGQNALATLTQIATKGRSLGMHLLITSQSLVGIPREVLVNLRSRLALFGTDEVELLQLGIKDRFPVATGETKAALLSQDGQTFSVIVPLGARRVPRPAV